MSRTSDYQIVEDPTDGYRRLEPIPSGDELGQFYQSEYYHLLKSGARAPDIRRLLEGGDAAARERAWLEHTTWSDLAENLRSHAPGRRVLEVGCGAGMLLAWLQKQGFEVLGVEPSTEAVEVARQLGVSVELGGIETLANDPRRHGSFDAIALMNVLEHTPNPAEVLAQARALLAPGGLLCVRVPNDFSALQRNAQRALAREPWWIAVPDHVHYFDYASLRRLLERLGYEVVDQHADFPMELFLLMGDDYTRDPQRGAACHQRRVHLEMQLDAPLRRALYRKLAEVGMGRACTLYARPRAATTPRVDMAALRRERGGYTYTALRRCDIEALRGFRNAQLDVLRQKAPLSAEQQERWYDTVVTPAHRSAAPPFLLVSILDAAGAFVGYGGVVHLDWEHQRGEVSFLVDPARAAQPAVYRDDLLGFFGFVREWAFDELGLHRLHTETYDFRGAHIALLEEAGLQLEGRLRGHITHPHQPGRFADSLLHGLCRDDR